MFALEARHLSKVYGRGASAVHALQDVSFELASGETMGIVGESGCGKSTLAKALCRLISPDEGSVILMGADYTSVRGRAKKDCFRQLQMVFQNPLDSFDPKMTLGKSITEAARNFGMSAGQAEKKMFELLLKVGLPDEYAQRYPHQVSGGECQRAAIARALMVDPAVLICDEATSALDVSAQAAVLNLLCDLKRDTSMSLLFITHDLAVAQILCDRIAVMQKGQIVETGSSDEIINHPQNDYTKALLSSVLSVGNLATGEVRSNG